MLEIDIHFDCVILFCSSILLLFEIILNSTQNYATLKLLKIGFQIIKTMRIYGSTRIESNKLAATQNLIS